MNFEIYKLFNVKGNVYVKCPSVNCAVAAVNALHGRWFAGKLTDIIIFKFDLSTHSSLEHVSFLSCFLFFFD